MNPGEAVYRLELLGTFRLWAPGGKRIDIASKKGMALVAMLAMAAGGERTRAWLQDRLWGSRQKEQAQQSLRRELVNLRQCLNEGEQPIIWSDHDRIRLDLNQLRVDVLEAFRGDTGQDEEPRALGGEFLEGFDIPGEEGFEDWLREQRQLISARLARGKTATGDREAASRAAPAPAQDLPGRPAIAVLPVADKSGDRELAYVAERIGDELIDRLSRLRWLPVIDPGRDFQLAAGRAGRSEAGSALGARYLLESQLLEKKGELALAASVHDAFDGRVVWSVRVDLPPGAARETMNDVMRDLVAALDARIEAAEQERVLHAPIESLSVDELILRGRWHLNRLTRPDAEIAQGLLDKALAARPNSAEALLQSAFGMAWSIWTGRQPEARIKELRARALRAIAADKFDARGHHLVGMAETWLRRPLRAKLSLEQAIALNPSLGQAYMQLGSALYLGGDPEAALEPMRTALHLNPQDNHLFCVLAELGMVHCMLGHYPEAAENADLALIRKPAYWYAHVIKINALVRGGDLAGARIASADLRAAHPGFTPDYVDWLPFVDPAWVQFLKDGLERSRPG